MTPGRNAILRFTKNGELRAAVAAGGWTLSGTAVGRFASAAALLLAAAPLGTSSYGALSLAVTTTFTITAFSSLGLPVAATKLISENWSQDREAAHALMRAAFWLTATAGTLAALAFLAVADVVSTRVLEQPEVLPLLFAATPLILLSPLAEVFASMLARIEQFRTIATYRAFRGILYGALVSVVLVVHPTAMTVLLAIVVAESTSCVLGWVLVHRNQERAFARAGSRTQTFAMVRPLMRVGLPAILASVSITLALWLCQVLLSRQDNGLDQVGIFAVAYRWHVLALFIPATMSTILLPMLGRLRSAGRHHEAYALFRQYGGLTVLVTLPAAIALGLLSAQIMSLQGQDYAVGAPVLAVLALAVLPSSLNNVFSQMALAQGRIALWVRSDLALSAVLLVTAAVTIPSLDALGLAWACLAAYVATCLVLIPVLTPPHTSPLQSHTGRP